MYYVCMHVCVCVGAQRSEEGIRSPNDEATRGCEMPDVDAENRIAILQKSNKGT